MDLEAVDERIQVSPVQFLASPLGPLFGEIVWRSEDGLGDFVEVLFDMEAIHNLDRVGEELISSVPDERGAVGDDDLPFGPGETSSFCLAHDALGEGREGVAGIR